ncbi:hypothetical protein N7462_000897 [Penicillium macrosclerotiorum]|uniref:uncharacterized protein n=1 Tax=Penicillium macrosclerotiorum TaxID=303699 RepID=UPI0025481897|nr:uncharacterized protein N7462_000897 [Penicillium macrosclerotiorum]KAJ5698892.1 hypothetical protein N7462_000897 [Penicillium macrosclerotiorum]
MPLKQSNPDPRSLTLLLKKHKTTVLLSLQPHEPLSSAKEKLLEALQSRELREINGDSIPTDPALIEFGVPVDRGDLEKGWTRLQADTTDITNVANAPSKGKSKIPSDTVMAAGLGNGHLVAFRFRNPGEIPERDELEVGLDVEDSGWDVVIPSFDDEEEL